MVSQRFGGERHSATVFICQEVVYPIARHLLCSFGCLAFRFTITLYRTCAAGAATPSHRCRNVDRIHVWRINTRKCPSHSNKSLSLFKWQTSGKYFGDCKISCRKKSKFRANHQIKIRRSKTDVSVEFAEHEHEHDPPAKRQILNCYVSLAHIGQHKIFTHFWQLTTTVGAVIMASYCVFGRISKLRSLNRIIAGKKWFGMKNRCECTPPPNGHSLGPWHYWV